MRVEARLVVLASSTLTSAPHVSHPSLLSSLTLAALKRLPLPLLVVTPNTRRLDSADDGGCARIRGVIIITYDDKGGGYVGVGGREGAHGCVGGRGGAGSLMGVVGLVELLGCMGAGVGRCGGGWDGRQGWSGVIGSEYVAQWVQVCRYGGLIFIPSLNPCRHMLGTACSGGSRFRSGRHACDGCGGPMQPAHAEVHL